MVGEDGVARVVDFGIASATARLQTTGDGQVKGKLSYMAPEQIRGLKIDRRVDVFAAGIVLWQLLTGAQFAAGVAEQRINFILGGRYRKPSELNSAVSPQLDEIVMKALSANPATRFATAEELSRALARIAAPAAAFEVAGWVRSLAGPFLKERALLVQAAENASIPPPPNPSHPDVSSISKGTDTEASETRRVPVVLVPVAAGDSTDTVVTRTASDPTGVPRVRRVGAVGGLVVLIAALTFWVARSESASGDASVASNATQVAALEPPRAPAAAPAFSEDGALAGTPKDALPQPAPEPASSASAKPVTTAPETRARKVRPAPPPVVAAPVASAPKVKDPCSPPYVLLEGGIRKYKPECL
jgi:serine/threonine protein kinase